MKYPDRKIATFIESDDPDTRAQGVELARILVDERTPDHEQIGALVTRLGVVRWSDRIDLLRSAKAIADALHVLYPRWSLGYGYIEAQRAFLAIESAMYSANQNQFLLLLNTACGIAPRSSRLMVRCFHRYSVATLKGTTRRNRALRIARLLLAGGVQ